MPNKLQPGKEVVPGYVLVRRLGAGGSGEVWVARASGGVEVAIKILTDLALIASDRELDALRVVREAKHPNLCPMFGVWFFDADDNLLSSQETELILGANTDLTETVAIGATKTRDVTGGCDPLDEGTLVLPDDTTKPAQMVVAMGLGEQTLMDRLVQVQAEKEQVNDDTLAIDPDASSCDNQVGIDADELMRYMSSAASAIDELNVRHNIYHCDIKPQNILLVGGQAQVCDFGLARKVEDSRKTTIAFGTPAYGAPEMLFERTYSKTIDQYSLAVTYYELRTGKLPYSSVTQSALLRAKATGEVDLSRVSPAERDVLARATDLDPEKRYKNCMTMVAALDEAIKNPNVEAATPTKAKLGLAAPVAAVSVIALLMALGFLVPWRTLIGDALTASSSMIGPQPGGEPVAEVASLGAGESSRGMVDPTVPTARSETAESELPDPEVADPEAADPETVDPETAQIQTSKPEPTEPDLNQRLVAAMDADAPNPERLGNVLAIVRSSDAAPGTLAPTTLQLLVEAIEQETAGKSDSTDLSLLQNIVQLCAVLIPIAETPDTSDPSSVARLALSKLIAASKVAGDGGGKLTDSDIDSVRLYFNDQNEFAHSPVAYRAAMAVASTWPTKLKSSNWNRALAAADVARAQQLAGEANESDPALADLNQAYLIALLSSRSNSKDLDSLNMETVRTAGMLEEHAAYGSLARSAISLADPTATTRKTKPLEGSDALLETIPEQLQAAFLLGAGWNFWNHNRNKDAVEQWEQAVELPTADLAASSDRHAAAQHLLDWLLVKASVSDGDVSKLRYADKSAAVAPLLAITRKLAKGNATLLQRVDTEQFVLSVAAGDFKQAQSRWSQLELDLNDTANLSRQQGRALFELSMNHATTWKGKLDPQWANRLLVACNAQVDPDLFDSIDSRPANASAARDDLFRRCFKPTMDRLRDQIRVSKQAEAGQTEPAGIDQQSLATFCDRFVSLLTESDRRPDYGAVSPCMKDIQFAASIAGNSSNEPIRRSELYFHAANAYSRDAREEVDNRRHSELIAQLREYRDLSKKYGSSGYTDCLDGLISLEVAFRETDPKTSFDLDSDAVAKFTNAIHSKASNKQSVLSFAHSGRALALQRGAILLSAERRDRQLSESLEDARTALKASQDSPYDREYALENLARICCAISQISETLETKERLSLIAEATHAVEGAIAIRKNKSLDDTPLSLTKLFVLWIDTLVSKDSSYANASIQRAKKWMKETEQAGKQAKSSRWMCNWYFYAAMILEQAEETDLALNYLITARQICSRDLEKSDRLTHLVTLAHINIKSYRTHVGSRREKLQLINELTQDLNSMVDPPPPIASVRDEYLGVLEQRKSAL